MSIRRTIQSMLDDEQKQAEFQQSPETFFAEQGMDDLPSDLIGTSFVHYSDTAPIEHADAVAGVATHFSSVPFEAEDLPEFSGADADPFATLTTVPDDRLDPDDADRGDEPSQPGEDDTDSHDPHALDDADTPDDLDASGHGAGDHEADELDSSDPELDAQDDALNRAADAALDGDPLDEGEFGMGYDDGPTEILGEIHGGGTLDPGADDPFFDDETITEGSVADVAGSPVEETMTGLTDPEAGAQYESFAEEVVEAFVDVDPSDLDLDDL